MTHETIMAADLVQQDSDFAVPTAEMLIIRSIDNMTTSSSSIIHHIRSFLCSSLRLSSSSIVNTHPSLSFQVFRFATHLSFIFSNIVTLDDDCGLLLHSYPTHALPTDHAISERGVNSSNMTDNAC